MQNICYLISPRMLDTYYRLVHNTSIVKFIFFFFLVGHKKIINLVPAGRTDKKLFQVCVGRSKQSEVGTACCSKKEWRRYWNYSTGGLHQSIRMRTHHARYRHNKQVKKWKKIKSRYFMESFRLGLYKLKKARPERSSWLARHLVMFGTKCFEFASDCCAPKMMTPCSTFIWPLWQRRLGWGRRKKKRIFTGKNEIRPAKVMKSVKPKKEAIADQMATYFSLDKPTGTRAQRVRHLLLAKKNTV